MTTNRPGTHPEAAPAVTARHVAPHHGRQRVARPVPAPLFAVHGLIQLLGFAAAAGLVELLWGTEPPPAAHPALR